jgi:hypothetical protein
VRTITSQAMQKGEGSESTEQGGRSDYVVHDVAIAPVKYELDTLDTYGVTVYRTDGTQETTTHATYKAATKALFSALPRLELVWMFGDEGEDDCYCDEEGRLKNLAPNPHWNKYVGDLVRVRKLKGNGTGAGKPHVARIYEDDGTKVVYECKSQIAAEIITTKHLGKHLVLDPAMGHNVLTALACNGLRPGKPTVVRCVVWGRETLPTNAFYPGIKGPVAEICPDPTATV